MWVSSFNLEEPVNDGIIKDMIAAFAAMTEGKPEPIDTVGTVTRVENGTAWVHIPGGVDETPVSMTINAKPGDAVQVRIGGGRAWLVGNSTAPPTDNTKAEEAEERAIKAAGTATNFVTDLRTGIFVHPANDKTSGIRINSRNIKIYALRKLAALIGLHDETNAQIIALGDSISITNPTEAVVAVGPGHSIEEYGVAFGLKNNVQCGGFAFGENIKIDGNSTATIPERPIGARTTAIGCFNECDANNIDYAFQIGNGSGEDYRSNAYDVKWNGDVNITGKLTHKRGALITTGSAVLDDITVADGSSSGTQAVDVTKTGYKPIGVLGVSVTNATTSGANGQNCCLFSFVPSHNVQTNKDYINVAVKNTGSVAAKIKITAHVAYIASAAL